MILTTTGSFDSQGKKDEKGAVLIAPGTLTVNIDVQPNTELEHELLLLLFQDRTVALVEKHEGNELYAIFTITDHGAEGLAFRNLQRVKNGQPRFMSVAAEGKAAKSVVPKKRKRAPKQSKRKPRAAKPRKGLNNAHNAKR
jgi:hypothetical protein